jgi:hypothetical protein
VEEGGGRNFGVNFRRKKNHVRNKHTLNLGYHKWNSWTHWLNMDPGQTIKTGPSNFLLHSRPAKKAMVVMVFPRPISSEKN